MVEDSSLKDKISSRGKPSQAERGSVCEVAFKADRRSLLAAVQHILFSYRFDAIAT